MALSRREDALWLLIISRWAINQDRASNKKSRFKSGGVSHVA
jgi:hypothetical protein